VKSKLDVQQYLAERDAFRAADGKGPAWAGANISLHHKLLGRSCKVGDRVITQRIGLTKRWQWHSARADNCCHACGDGILGIEHPLRLCRSQAMIDARSHWWGEVDHFIARSPLHHQHILQSIAKHARESPGGETACCGIFLPHFVDGLPNKDCLINESEGKLILKLFKCIAGGCRRILRLAAETQLGPLGVNFRQATITDFSKTISPPVGKKITSAGRLPAGKKIRKEITYVNKNLKPTDIFYTTPSMTHNNVVYWEFKAG
jgi:hypothetical protein